MVTVISWYLRGVIVIYAKKRGLKDLDFELVTSLWWWSLRYLEWWSFGFKCCWSFIMQKLIAGPTQFLLWKVNMINLRERVLDDMFHAALNLSLRVAYELEQQKEVWHLPLFALFSSDWNALLDMLTNNASRFPPSFSIKASTFFLMRINHVDPANSFRFYISELMGQWKRSMRNLKKLDFSWNPQGWSLTML